MIECKNPNCRRKNMDDATVCAYCDAPMQPDAVDQGEIRHTKLASQARATDRQRDSGGPVSQNVPRITVPAPGVMDPGAAVRTSLAPQAAQAEPASANPAAVRGPQPAVAGEDLGPHVVGWMISFSQHAPGQEHCIRAGKTTIGRSRDNDISLWYSATASERHATMLTRPGGKLFITDCSTNGTLVNGEMLDPGVFTQLKSGDSIAMGGLTFLLFIIDATQAKALWPGKHWG